VSMKYFKKAMDKIKPSNEESDMVQYS